MNEETDGQGVVAQVPDELSRLLRHPIIIWGCRATNQMDATRAKFDEEEYVQGLQAKGFNGEAIARQQLLMVVVEKATPADGTGALTSRVQMVTTQETSAGGQADGVTQFLQFSLDFAVTPTSIFPCKPYDERLKGGGGGGASRLGFRLAPFASDKLTVSAQNGFGLKELKGNAQLLQAGVTGSTELDA